MIQKKKDIIKSLAINKKDVGSAEIQIGLLSSKIERLAVHFKKYKKDKHSTIGLSKSVNKRKKLLSEFIKISEFIKTSHLKSSKKKLKRHQK